MQDIARTMITVAGDTTMCRCLRTECKDGIAWFKMWRESGQFLEWLAEHAHPTFSKGDRVRLTRKFWEEMGLTRYEFETAEPLTVDHVKDNGMIHCAIGEDGKRHMFWDADDLELVTE